jgi:thioredoxin reductase (NADPH)
MEEDKLKVYGAEWCPKTALLKNYLQSEWVDFEYLNPETDENAKQDLMNLYDGKVKFPTVVKGDRHLKNPKIPELRAFIKESE